VRHVGSSARSSGAQVATSKNDFIASPIMPCGPADLQTGCAAAGCRRAPRAPQVAADREHAADFLSRKQTQSAACGSTRPPLAPRLTVEKPRGHCGRELIISLPIQRQSGSTAGNNFPAARPFVAGSGCSIRSNGMEGVGPVGPGAPRHRRWSDRRWCPACDHRLNQCPARQSHPQGFAR